MAGMDDIEKITPEEMEALAEVLHDSSSGLESSAEEDAVVLKYDLVGASGSPRHSMPVLDLVHDRFAHSLKEQLTRATRVEGSVEIDAPKHGKAAEVYGALESPCSVIAVDAVGLDTMGMLVITPHLMMHLLDLCIGGTGANESVLKTLELRGFSKTEERLSEHLIRFIGRAVTKAWSEVADVNLNVLRLESNPRHAVILNPNDAVISFPVSLNWKDVEGQVVLVLPLSCLRPIESRLASTVVGVKKDAASPWQDAMFQHIEETPVELIVELGKAELTLRQLLDLQEGELVRLDKEPGGNLEIRVEGTPKYNARPVVHHGNMAVEVLDVLTTGEE